MSDPLKHPFLNWTPTQAYEDGYDDGRVGKMLNPFGRSMGELVHGASREQWVAWRRGNIAGHSDRPEVVARVSEMTS